MKIGMSPSFKEGVSAFVADLIAAVEFSPIGYAYRPFGCDAFEDSCIGYHVVRNVRDALLALKWIEIKPGSGKAEGYATRIRIARDLLALAASFGITSLNLADHFQRRPRPTFIAHPLKLRKGSELDKGRHHRGKVVPVDLSRPDAAALATQVNDINAFMARQKIEPDKHLIFQRGFNQADAPDFRFNKGGRIYSLGDSYQQMPSKLGRKKKDSLRSALTINDETTVEIDIKASHLTIVRHKLGMDFNPHEDPYDGLPIPRHVAKSWVLMILAYHQFQSRWSDEAKKAHVKEADERGVIIDKNALTKDFPVEGVEALMLARHPILLKWHGSGMTWADLQFWESSAVVNTVHELAMVHDIPALPVHDSIIVPVSKRSIAEKVLKAHFKAAVGIEPCLTVK